MLKQLLQSTSPTPAPNIGSSSVSDSPSIAAALSAPSISSASSSTSATSTSVSVHLGSGGTAVVASPAMMVGKQFSHPLPVVGPQQQQMTSRGVDSLGGAAGQVSVPVSVPISTASLVASAMTGSSSCPVTPGPGTSVAGGASSASSQLSPIAFQVREMIWFSSRFSVFTFMQMKNEC